MGSWFSSPAAGDSKRLVSLIPSGRVGRTISLSSLGPEDDGRVFSEEEIYADCVHRLAHLALKHYNGNNQGAEFQYPAEFTTDMKAACVGFGERLFWYHLCFSARRRDNQDMHLFFAELCYDMDSTKTAIKTCTVLEEPLGRFKSSCAFCPEESKIMHPRETEFICGKEGQQTEFFRRRFDICDDDRDL